MFMRGWRDSSGLVHRHESLSSIPRIHIRKPSVSWAWWHTPLVLALGRQGHLCEFEASLVYRESSRTARATQRNAVSKTQKEKQTKTMVDQKGLVSRLWLKEGVQEVDMLQAGLGEGGGVRGHETGRDFRAREQ